MGSPWESSHPTPPEWRSPRLSDPAQSTEMGSKFSKSSKEKDEKKWNDFKIKAKLPERLDKYSTLPASFRRRQAEPQAEDGNTGTLPRNLNRNESFSKRFRKSIKSWASQKGLVEVNRTGRNEIEPKSEESTKPSSVILANENDIEKVADVGQLEEEEPKKSDPSPHQTEVVVEVASPQKVNDSKDEIKQIKDDSKLEENSDSRSPDGVADIIVVESLIKDADTQEVTEHVPVLESSAENKDEILQTAVEDDQNSEMEKRATELSEEIMSEVETIMTQKQDPREENVLQIIEDNESFEIVQEQEIEELRTEKEEIPEEEVTALQSKLVDGDDIQEKSTNILDESNAAVEDDLVQDEIQVEEIQTMAMKQEDVDTAEKEKSVNISDEKDKPDEQIAEDIPVEQIDDDIPVVEDVPPVDVKIAGDVRIDQIANDVPIVDDKIAEDSPVDGISTGPIVREEVSKSERIEDSSKLEKIDVDEDLVSKNNDNIETESSDPKATEDNAEVEAENAEKTPEENTAEDEKERIIEAGAETNEPEKVDEESQNTKDEIINQATNGNTQEIEIEEQETSEEAKQIGDEDAEGTNREKREEDELPEQKSDLIFSDMQKEKELDLSDPIWKQQWNLACLAGDEGNHGAIRDVRDIIADIVCTATAGDAIGEEESAITLPHNEVIIDCVTETSEEVVEKEIPEEKLEEAPEKNEGLNVSKVEEEEDTTEEAQERSEDINIIEEKDDTTEEAQEKSEDINIIEEKDDTTEELQQKSEAININEEKEDTTEEVQERLKDINVDEKKEDISEEAEKKFEVISENFANMKTEEVKISEMGSKDDAAVGIFITENIEDLDVDDAEDVQSMKSKVKNDETPEEETDK